MWRQIAVENTSILWQAEPLILWNLARTKNQDRPTKVPQFTNIHRQMASPVVPCAAPDGYEGAEPAPLVVSATAAQHAASSTVPWDHSAAESSGAGGTAKPSYPVNSRDFLSRDYNPKLGTLLQQL